MDFSNFLSSTELVTKDLISYVPILPLQNGYWLAMRQGDVALSNAVALYLITIP